ncbi:hypothetical protein ACFQGT_11095 [Natrialbaceae archaeon GCM10025810]|uniref:hypothetical protein n=1 Tax=Halovalidus salilacus TaxID=3075124 RepID=UPI00362349D9
MTERTATFEIDSRGDARSASRALDELYNRFREEDFSKDSDDGTDEMLEEFEALRDAVDDESAGQLIVTYRSRGDGSPPPSS